MLKLIKNASILSGEGLDFIKKGYILIDNTGTIKEVNEGNYNESKEDIECIDADGYLIAPGLINAHTHIADSIGKDIGVNLDIDERINPIWGIKKNILNNTDPNLLKVFIKNTAISMIKNGITTFVDFREGGIQGVKILKEGLINIPIKSIILGRIEYYFNLKELDELERKDQSIPSEYIEELKKILDISDGIGISGANENTDRSLAQFSKIIKNLNEKNHRKYKLFGIHAAESKHSQAFSKILTQKTEIEKIVENCEPDFFVHVTNATRKDIQKIAETGKGIIICPRANGTLAVGIPDIESMMREGCKIAIGTDNIMINSPDILREMDYIWKVSRGRTGLFINSKEILKMVTVNAAKILRINSGWIEKGRDADLIFIEKNHIDLFPIRDPYSSIVQRVTEDSIKEVMIDGQMVKKRLYT